MRECAQYALNVSALDMIFKKYTTSVRMSHILYEIKALFRRDRLKFIKVKNMFKLSIPRSSRYRIDERYLIGHSGSLWIY
jgi:hypothetical protein